jgi:hypothetical protein
MIAASTPAAVILVTALAGLAAAAGVDAAIISLGVAVAVMGATFASVLGEAGR